MADAHQVALCYTEFRFADRLGNNNRVASRGRQRMRILIAEDDPILAEGLARSLRDSGYAVDCVTTGAEADCAIAALEFDLLILG